MNLVDVSPTVRLLIAAITAGLPTLTVLVSLLINNQRLTDFGRRIDQRFADTNKRIEDVKETLRAEMYRVEQVLDARLRHLDPRPPTRPHSTRSKASPWLVLD